jgi:hypothetical protein
VREEAFDTMDTSTWAQAEREKYANFTLRKAYESRNVKHLKMAIRAAEELERDSLRIYVARDSAEYMEATKVLKEVEADVKEKFANAQKSRNVRYHDQYEGIAMASQIEMKEAKDQLRKAIVSMVGIDEALTHCRKVPGFKDVASHVILIQWAKKVKAEGELHVLREYHPPPPPPTTHHPPPTPTTAHQPTTAHHPT